MTTPGILVVTGASGSGKTTTVRALEARALFGVRCYYFDAVGVPFAEDRGSGGPDGWQAATLLAAAGFQKRPADSADQARSLASMPPFKLVVRGMGGDVAYTYADPVDCRCLYTGGPNEYVKYQRLATERDIAEGALWPEDDGMDWGLWGGGWWLR